MNERLRQLETLSHHPSLKIDSRQNAMIVWDIVHSVMYPYFLKKSPEDQERLKGPVVAHLQKIAAYSLREFVDISEPYLSIEFIKGLHRVLYNNIARIPVKAIDGSMTTMEPGNFKTTPVFMRRSSNPNEWFGTTEPEHVPAEMKILLEHIYDSSLSPFERYFKLMLKLTLIHPFPDSNGKLARLLGELFLLKQGIHPVFLALYETENKTEISELAERYITDPQLDISIFYPVAIKRYQACLGLNGEASA